MIGQLEILPNELSLNGVKSQHLPGRKVICKEAAKLLEQVNAQTNSERGRSNQAGSIEI
jgi:hypothetical protein